MKSILVTLAIIGAMLAGSANSVQAAQVTFTIDSALSFLTVTPSTTIFGTPLATSSQGDGSFTANYSGVIVADISATTIQLLSPTMLIAGISGDWLPGTDYSNYPTDLADPKGYISTPVPANYGIVTDLSAIGPVQGKNGLSESAIRNLRVALVDSAPKALNAGAFDEAGTDTDFTSGTVFYSSGGVPPTTDLASTVAPGATIDALGTGTFATLGNVQTLTIPVTFNVSYNVNFLTLTTQYSGTIIATAAVPEPGSLTLVSFGLGTLLLYRRRVVRQSQTNQPTFCIRRRP